MLTCKDASHLISERRDRPLAARERWGLRAHLWICANCRRFARQVDLLRQAARELSRRLEDAEYGPELSAEARQRIREALAERRGDAVR
jgi:hypothetical protein